MKDLVIFSGNSNRVLAEAICKELDLPLGKAKVSRFADGEVRVQLLENVRKKEVFIIQSTQPPAEHWDELCFMIDAARRGSAKEITAVIPYCGYSRQERKDQPRVSISLKVKLDQVVAAGANRIILVDIHAPATQGFVNIPCDNLFAAPLLLARLKSLFTEENRQNTCFVTDLGYSKVAGVYAKKLGCELVIARKTRVLSSEDELEERIDLIGKIKPTCIFIDDLTSTFRTARYVGQALKAKEAEKLIAVITHPLLSHNPDNEEKDAIFNIARSPFNELIFSDSVPLPVNLRLEGVIAETKIEVISLAPLLASAIKEVNTGGSISGIFDKNMKQLSD